jgi:hypothetical protein
VRGDVCTDPSCFRAKAEAAKAKLLAKALKQGYQPMGAEAPSLFHDSGELRQLMGWLDIDSTWDNGRPKKPTYREVIGQQVRRHTFAAVDPMGKLRYLAPTKIVEAALRDGGHVPQPEKPAWQATPGNKMTHAQKANGLIAKSGGPTPEEMEEVQAPAPETTKRPSLAEAARYAAGKQPSPEAGEWHVIVWDNGRPLLRGSYATEAEAQDAHEEEMGTPRNDNCWIDIVTRRLRTYRYGPDATFPEDLFQGVEPTPAEVLGWRETLIEDLELPAKEESALHAANINTLGDLSEWIVSEAARPPKGIGHSAWKKILHLLDDARADAVEEGAEV